MVTSGRAPKPSFWISEAMRCSAYDAAIRSPTTASPARTKTVIRTIRGHRRLRFRAGRSGRVKSDEKVLIGSPHRSPACHSDNFTAALTSIGKIWLRQKDGRIGVIHLPSEL